MDITDTRANELSEVKGHTVIAEGKTKFIRQIFGITEDHVFIDSKDDVTAGDGAKRDVLEGKGVWSTQTSVNCFTLLARHGIPTHFVQRHGPRVFRAKRVRMIPIECIARRVATGTYLKRNPEVTQGTPFNPLVIELNYKDDDAHDPYMIWEEERDRFLLYDLKQPISRESVLGEVTPEQIFQTRQVSITTNVVHTMKQLTAQTFEIFEAAWKKHHVTLVDLKIECGMVGSSDQIVVADVIDNDSWRIWPDGDKTQQLDKQTYRDLVAAPTAEDIALLKGNYAKVAEMTDAFLLPDP